MSKSETMIQYPEGWDNWAHAYLMGYSPAYNSAWWSGSYTLCLAAQKELIWKLNPDNW